MIQENKKNRFLLNIFTAITILCMSVCYAAFNTELSISGDAYVRVHQGVRITNLKMIGATNEGFETYNSKYSLDTTSMFVTLPNSQSTVTYEVEITNNTNSDYLITNVLESSYTNTNVKYQLIDFGAYSEIKAGEVSRFKIRLYYDAPNLSNESSILSLTFLFAIDDLEPPVLATIKDEWTFNEQTVKINSPGTATSGVKTYEYYLSSSATVPTYNISATGTTSGELTVSNNGVNYVYYRTVANSNRKSVWSKGVKVKIDKTVPTIQFNPTLESHMTKGDDVALVQSYTTGNLSGTTYSCQTNDGHNILNMKQITAVGNYTIVCTVKTGAGKTTSISKVVKVTYDPYKGSNLIPNGTFNNGTANWKGSSYFGVFQGYATYTVPAAAWSSAAGVDTLTVTSTTKTHKFYLAVSARTATNSFGFGFGTDPYGSGVFFSNPIPASSNFTVTSTIIQPTTAYASVTTGYFSFYKVLATSGEETAYFDYAIAIDLTATFGSGNEPSKLWCDRHITYFDGSKTIYY